MRPIRPRIISAGAVLLSAILLPSSLLRGADSPDRNISQQIDRLIEDACRKKGVQPNAPASDEVFLRRTYLNIAGRIPTAAEAREFLESEAPGKRSALIDRLLDSPAHVSRQFNYWADLLRLRSDIQGDAGEAYADWLKGALRENKSYDAIVRELVAAQGYVWDNAAVGYYMRDAGMPLDNMSNTAQVFLGTRLVCAQCHDHPFDKWSQKDYYELAAYTYGVETRIDPDSVVGLDKLEERRKRRRSYEGIDAHLRQAVNEVLQPLSYGVRDTGRTLRLPDDYQYKDSRPGEMVEPDTPFGRSARSSRNQREAYVRWMTAPENPRFTLVIANRLWKQVMGRGLIEPVDDLKDDTEASNPELMSYLTRQMAAMQYDMKRFLRVLYNTRTFQRETTAEEVYPDQSYHFPGPVLRRLDAEQLWDSVLTAVIPSVDLRRGKRDYLTRQNEIKKQAEQLMALKPQDILKLAEPIAAAEREFDEKARNIRQQILAARESGSNAEADRLQGELDRADGQRRETIERLRREQSAQNAAMMSRSPAMATTSSGAGTASPATPEDERWQGFPDDFVRASELPSPAPAGHFLHLFGQSDREVIENAHQDPSVAQVLALLNGPLSDHLASPQAVVTQACAAAHNDEEREDILFLSLLGRRPSDDERATIRGQVQARGSFDKARPALVWALLNTQEFLFYP
ncbi:MAG TPA: DUF1549 domain-containing protein [Verrucomicrobiales bacterium]|nr:DUF1549 domain-containing protein [Verrucomicrobiales bacterium]